jgi:hypothetical protein
MSKKQKYDLENEVIKLITMLGVGLALLYYLADEKTQQTIAYYVTAFKQKKRRNKR